MSAVVPGRVIEAFEWQRFGMDNAMGSPLYKRLLDITIAEVQLASTPPLDPSSWPGLVPVHGPDGHLDAVELRGFARDSPLRAAGLAEGDQLLAIDGYSLADNTINGAGLLPARHLGWTVVEIARAHHHVVLSIHWQVR